MSNVQKNWSDLMYSIGTIAILIYCFLILPFRILYAWYNPDWFVRLWNSILTYKWCVLLIFFVNIIVILLKILPFKKNILLRKFLKYYPVIVCLWTFIYPFFSNWIFWSYNVADFYAFMLPLYLMLYFIRIAVTPETFKKYGFDENENVEMFLESSKPYYNKKPSYSSKVYLSFMWHLFLFCTLIYWLDFIGKIEDWYFDTFIQFPVSIFCILLSSGIIYLFSSNYKEIFHSNWKKLSIFTKWFSKWNKEKLSSTNKNSWTNDQKDIIKNDESSADFWNRMKNEYENRDINKSNMKDEYITIKDFDKKNGSKSKKLSKSKLILTDIKLTGEVIEISKKEDDSRFDLKWKKFLKSETDRLDRRIKWFKETIIASFILPWIIYWILIFVHWYVDHDFDYHFPYRSLLIIVIISWLILLYNRHDYKTDKKFYQHIKDWSILKVTANIKKFIPHNEKWHIDTEKNRKSWFPEDEYTFTMVISDGEHEFRSWKIPIKYCSDFVYDEENEVLDNIKSLFRSFAKPKSMEICWRTFKIWDKILVLVDPDDYWYYRLNFPFN